jgi:hypothetical protein
MMKNPIVLNVKNIGLHARVQAKLREKESSMLKPGSETSEGKRSKTVLILGLIMSVIGLVCSFVVDNYALEGTALSIVSLLATVANSMSYSRDRRIVKSVEMQAEALKKSSVVGGGK